MFAFPGRRLLSANHQLRLGGLLRGYRSSRTLLAPVSPQEASRSSRVKGITWAAFGVFAVAAVGVTFAYVKKKEQMEKEHIEMAKQKQTVSVGKPKIGGPFSLVDENGIRRTEKDFLGKMPLVYFGFTYCPDICPMELTKMADALRTIEKMPDGKEMLELVQPLFISVDPKRDNLEQIKTYTKEFHPKLLGMTGNIEEIKEAARSYRVYFSTWEGEGGEEDYLVDHSIFFYLMGPDGSLVDYFGQNKTTEELTQGLAGYLREELSKRKATS